MNKRGRSLRPAAKCKLPATGSMLLIVKNKTMKIQKVYKDKIPGFTLLEQIIVLALTTILVLIGFTAVLNFQQLIVRVRDNAAKDRSVYLLHGILENDFRNSETIGWDGTGLNIENSTGKVRYEFTNLCLIREASETIDTFRFAVSDMAISNVDGTKALVEAISFNLSDQIQSYKMSFLKKYPDYKLWEASEYGN
jgi:Tfp pilus assembly protein PilE